MKNVLFLLNDQKDKKLVLTKKIIGFLFSFGLNVYAEEHIASRLDGVLSYAKEDVDFAIILGGDGTVLTFIQKYKDKDFPIFGINLGRVGCLCEGTLKDYQEKITSIINGDCYIENRNSMDVKIYDNNELKDKVLSFNEMTLHRGTVQKILLVNILVNGHNKTSFYADGVIVSTATGSSAYSLSSGGPLLLPDSKNFVIQPICPQFRTITSLVLDDSYEIEVSINDEIRKPKYKKDKPIITIDGDYTHYIDEKSVIKLSKSNKTLKVIRVERENSLFEPIYKVAMSTQVLFKKGDK